MESWIKDRMTHGAYPTEETIAASKVPILFPISQSDEHVMIRSTGNPEPYARYVHRESARALGPFIGFNCRTTPGHTIDHLLFVKTFSRARGGTLYIFGPEYLPRLSQPPTTHPFAG